MKLSTLWSAWLVLVALLVVATPRARAQSGNSNQQPAGGGTISEPATNRKPPAKTSVPKSPGTSKSARTRPKSAATAANVVVPIDGKWWTSGNDFGTSAVVFTQIGNDVSGQITYADGRTGNLTGVFSGKRLNYTWANSAGDHGSGWLEQSWSNFLGGTWRGQRTTNGSWTLNRIEGNWCFGGSRTRIRKVTHNARGALRLVTEDGEIEEGHLEGPYIILEDEGLSVKGEIYYKANRVDFVATGTYWTWCGR